MTKRLKVIRESTPEVYDDVDHLFISRNSKTGWSINTSIAETCRPTKACSEYCYGLVGRLAMPASLQRQAENTRMFSAEHWESLSDEAVDLTHVVSREQDFLRIFGVGDLQPGSVFFINQMAAYAKHAKPKLMLWVSTRKFDLADMLVDSPNLHVMLSFDETTPPKFVKQGRALIKERSPQFFAAWVRRRNEEKVPSWASVVFEEHGFGKGRANRKPHAKSCAATIHLSYKEALPHEGACERCRRCFDADKR